jgi:hypothetical protein
MWRFAHPSKAAPVLGIFTRSFHHKALSDDDQLAERLLDSSELMQGHWKDVDLEALADFDNTTSERHSLFSTNARIRSLMDAHKQIKDNKKEDTNDDLSDLTFDEMRLKKEDERHRRLLQRERDIASRSFESYEALLAAEGNGESVVKEESGPTDDTLLSTSMEEGDAVEDDERDDESMGMLKVPAFYDPKLSQTPVSSKDDPEVPARPPQDESSGVYTLPKTDPSKWDTEDVIAWLEAFGEEGLMDEHMKEAFRMVKVDGEMLLMKVSPPDLFKVMRKWHVQRSNDKTREIAGQLVVDTQLVNNTIYLCFPYCR